MQRVLRNTGASLSVTFYNDEVAVDADAAVTVTIVKGDGSALVTAAPTVHGTTGVYTYALAPQASVNCLTLTWTGTFSGAVSSIVTNLEIVGGTLFTLGAGRASDSSLSDTTKYPTADLIAARLDVETEFERICGASFFTRYCRETLNGRGGSRLALSHDQVTAIRSVTIVDSLGVQTAFTSTELASVRPSDTGVVERTTGIFPLGNQNVIVEYEYGATYVDPEIQRVALIRFRSLLNTNKGAIHDRATSFVEAGGGGTYRLDTAGELSTGIPDVDAVLHRPGINRRFPGFA